MRFYGICFGLMTMLLLLLPLMTMGWPKNPEESRETVEIITEEIKVDLPKEEDKQILPVWSAMDPPNHFKIKNSSTGHIDTVMVEDFVLGAVCSEMPATFHLEALKAQAVSARTWALYQQQWQKEQPDDHLQGADFQADPIYWKGYVTMEQARERFGEKFEEYWSVLTQAVEETKGQILCYDEQPIAAAYHAISNGSTEAAEYIWGNSLPYLQAVDSQGDELAPGYEESRSFSKSELAKLLSVEEEDLWLEILEHSPSAYVTKIQVGNNMMSGREFRTALGLRSSCFSISYGEDSITITTRGYGHGAGLSQYGADYMARQGSDYGEILAHYYKDAQLCRWT